MAKEIRIKMDIEGNAVDALKNIQKAYDDINKSAENAKKATEGIAGSPAIKPSVGADMNLNPTGKYYKQTQRKDREEMLSLAMAGDTTSESFIKLQEKTGDLRDVQDELNNRLKYFAQSGAEQAATALAEGVGVLGSTAQVAIGSMELLGISNEEATKTVAKLASVEAVMNGVKQISIALQSDSMFMLGLENAKMKTLAFTTSAYSAVVGTSTGALKAFRLALAGTGIGLAVIAVGALAQAWMDASTEADKYDKKVSQLSDDQIAKAKAVTNSIAQEKEKQRLLKIENKRAGGDEAGARALEQAYQDEQLAGLEKQRLQAEKDLKKINEDAEKAQAKQKANFEKEEEFRKKARVGGGAGTSASVVGLTKKEIENDRINSTNLQQERIIKEKEVEDLRLRQETIRMQKENDKLKKTKPETVQASAPKNFTLNIAELGRIDQVNIMSDEDEKAFQQRLVNAVMSAMTTAQARVAR